MKKSLPCLFLTSFALCGAPAHAASFSNCEVVEIVLAEGQNAHVRLSCIPTDLPPCAANNPWVGFDKQTTDGKQWLAMFTYAHAINAKVTGYTYATCPAFQSNVAQLSHLRVTR